MNAPASEPIRQPHASLNLASRLAKGRKIERILSLNRQQTPLKVLEVGTGAGGIAHYFGNHPDLACDVDAVDVQDNRQVTDGYRFAQVDGVILPFDDETFDVVISNHVIEHVGDERAQATHLREIHRVLKASGRAYLAVPNRWMLVEPHFGLVMLSWMPRWMADRYVRIAGKGSHYDCRPLTATKAESLLHGAGFDARQVHGEALRLTFELERPKAWLYRLVLKRIPDGGYRLLRRVFPTLIYALSKSQVR
ncbi:MAG TPA: class I SAM-dependent methyltransferase [Arenimonas sp.]|uniref:class I SAM-dependent methyltransferase n=1 Tax=Arenimonas sp. TaxID=1872635 RepID=UPI002D7FD6BC|nr:class I SAM-dependent methyltransferase [Arenimonas sp.]HEU0153889.1 class I SAM-dependent methyltransferase [Arenimonas sp.]